MTQPQPPRRLRHLPVATVLGREIPLANTFRSRLLGLSHLDRDEAGPGLLIPHCSSVHTFGMRFRLDVYFLDEANELLAVKRGVAARRAIACRRAQAVLEIPAAKGGEFSRLRP